VLDISTTIDSQLQAEHCSSLCRTEPQGVGGSPKRTGHVHRIGRLAFAMAGSLLASAVLVVSVSSAQTNNSASATNCTQNGADVTVSALLSLDPTVDEGYVSPGQEMVTCSGGTSATCEYVFLYTVVNGEIRAEEHIVDCTPVRSVSPRQGTE
jgi:hypothetical protein